MDEKTYKQLLNKKFSAQDINQIIKATEAGFDICNPDIWMPSDRLREFRQYLINNLEPIFNHDQLREIQIGFLKGIDITEYTDSKFTAKEMILMRKMLEDGKDVKILKENSTNENEMKTVYKALKSGLTKIDIEKYNCKQLEYILKCFAKKVDVRPLIDKGYNERQIATIHKYRNKYYDIVPYIDASFNHEKIDILGRCLSLKYSSVGGRKISFEDFKKIFNNKFNTEQLSFFEYSLKYDCLSVDLINPDYPASKMKLIKAMQDKKCSEKNINLVKNSNFTYERYYTIMKYLSENKFSTILVDPDIPDAVFKALKPTHDIKLFKDLVKKGFNETQIDYILRVESRSILLSEYAKTSDSLDNLIEKAKLIDYCKARNIKYVEEQFIVENVPFDKLNLYRLCKNLNVDFKKAKNLTVAKIKTVATYQEKKVDLLSYNLEEMDTVKINALGAALSKNLPIENILKNNDNSKFHIILSLENFNKENSRKIDIKEILNLDADAKTLGILISKLMSNSLEENIKGYKEMERIPKKEKEKIEEKSLFYEEHPDFY